MTLMARIPRLYWALALFCVAVTLARFDAFFYLWVYPLDAVGLPLWLCLATVDVILAALPHLWVPRARLLLWMGGVLWFTGRQDAPWIGLALVILPVALWLSSRKPGRKWGWLALALILLVFGHAGQTLHPGLEIKLVDLRLSVHVLAIFALYRGISWGMEVFVRGARPGFLPTMEYFLSPAFLLSPLHATVIVWTRMSEEPQPDRGLRPLGWIARGLATALLFSFVYRVFAAWIEQRYAAGIRAWEWWHYPSAGVLVFVFSYLEKSRVSYLAAGFLRFAGHDVSPDFKSPWLARDLLDYWRRFHYWILEFYRDNFFGPLSVWLSRRFSPGIAVALAVFLTFFLGTAGSHYVRYPGGVLACLWLGFLFGAVTLLHHLLAPLLRRAYVGIPFTWLTVMVLYLLAYPVFGLGWSTEQLMRFFQ